MGWLENLLLMLVWNRVYLRLAMVECCIDIWLTAANSTFQLVIEHIIEIECYYL